MSDISPYTQEIQNAVYGEQVRSSIINALNKVNDDNNSYSQIKTDILNAKSAVDAQVESFDGKVENAQTTLNSLQSKVSEANTAKTNLTNATNTANTAKNNLTSATNSANTAKTNLQTATTNANTATANANTAKSNLETATANANTAKTDVTSATTNANTAKSALNTSIQSANTANSNLENTISSANTAKNNLQTVINSSGTAKSNLSDVIVQAGTTQNNLEGATSRANTTHSQLVEENATANKNIEDLRSENFNAQEVLTGLLKVYPTETVEGNPASFIDGADNIPIKSLKVNITPIQDGSGDPSPTNVRPIRGWDSVKVMRSGENVLKPSSAFTETKNGLTFTSDGNGIYHIKGKSTSNNAVQSTIFQVPEFVIPLSETHTLYLNNNQADSGIAMRFMNGSTVIDSWTFGTVNRISTQYGQMGGKTCNGIQINVTSSAQPVDMTFIPMLTLRGYIGTYNISIPTDAGTVYGGTLDVVKGELIVDRKCVAMESITWSRTTSYAHPVFYSNVSDKASDYTKTCCSIFKNIDSPNVISAQGFASRANDGDYACSNNNAQIYVRLDSVTTVQDFVTAVTGQTIVYPLATPIVYTLTPQQVTSLLGKNNVWSDAGSVDVEYRTDIKLYIEKRLAELTA